MIDPALHTGGVGRCIYEWFWIGRSMAQYKDLFSEAPIHSKTGDA